MKKLIVCLLTVSLLTMAHPTQAANTSYAWAKKNIYALLGASIVAAGIAYYLAYATAPYVYSGNLDSSDNNVEHALEPNQKIVITSYFPGRIRVVGHDDAKASIRYDYHNLPFDLLPISISKTPTTLNLTAGNPTIQIGSFNVPVTRKIFTDDAYAYITMYVPKTSNIEIIHTFSDIFIEGVEGDINTKSTDSGNVTIEKATGKIKTLTTNGVVDVQGGNYVHVESQKRIKISGAKQQTIARSTKAPIDLIDCEHISVSTQGLINLARPRYGFIHPVGAGPLFVNGKKRQGYGRSN